MAFDNIAGKFVNEARLNPNIGTYSYILHRLTGIGLAVYLIMHTWVLSSAQVGVKAFDERLAFVQTPLFHFLEYFLIAIIFIHMINGIRIMITDFFSVTRIHKALFWIGLIIFLVMMVWFGFSMIPRIFEHGGETAQLLEVLV